MKDFDFEYSNVLLNGILLNIYYFNTLALFFSKKELSGFLKYCINKKFPYNNASNKNINLFYEEIYPKQEDISLYIKQILIKSPFYSYFRLANEIEQNFRNILIRIDNTIKRWDIVESLLHMNNNRLGIETQDESYIYWSIQKLQLNVK